MSEDVDDLTQEPAPDPARDVDDTNATPDATPDMGASDTASDSASEPIQIDVIGIEADLDGVQAALARLADGTYWTDEVTGEPIPADVLAADPLVRRV